jgi:hypothetical protein
VSNSKNLSSPQWNDEEKDITDNVNSELSQKYNLEYLKYQHKLYSEIFGINAIE